jgi:23S rRNA (guanosine2251-2'-O)-methyltransferase
MEIVAVLQNIRSLHNVGSIFRTAEAAGVKKLYLTGVTPSPLDRFGLVRDQLKKVSLGAEKNVLWEKVESTTDLIDQLKSKGYKIISVEQDKRSVSYDNFKLPNKKTAVVFGHEVDGVSKEILDKSDKIIEIPMSGKKESLNVSVAFGIVVFRLVHTHYPNA